MHDFQPLTIAAVKRETADAITLLLAVPPALAGSYRFAPGQHIPVRAVVEGDELRRTYSICSDPDDEHLAITIKRLDGGRFSTWAHASLKPGMTLDAMPPQGRFVLAPGDGAPRHILGLAAGAGITPIMAMLRHALVREPETRFTLIYGNRGMSDAIFGDALEDLKDLHLGRFALVHVLSREESDSPLLAGRITPATLAEIMKGIGKPEDIAHAYLCGPGSMIRDLRAALMDLGLPRERVHHEFFAPVSGAAPVQSPFAATPGPATTATADVVAIVDGARHRIALAPGETVLDAAVRTGLRVPFSCKAGMCCTCRARIVEGKAAMRVNYSLEPWEIERGFTLTCQTVPDAAAGRLVVDYDAM
jgi:ring-1,2-phenylacetyl-CoA epoxidase subunit PaaE